MRKGIPILIFALLAIGLIISGCSGSDSPEAGTDQELAADSCVKCHTAKETLMALAVEPESASSEEPEGEG